MQMQMDESLARVELDSQLENVCKFRYRLEPTQHRHTNIGCRIGRQSLSLDVLRKMVLEGMDLAFIDFTHESHDDHEDTVATIRQAVDMCGEHLDYQLHVAIAVGVRGADICIGSFDETLKDGVVLRRADKLRLSINRDDVVSADPQVVFIDYPNIITAVKPGDRIWINNGAIAVTVKKVSGDGVKCMVLQGGKLEPHSNVILPSPPLDLPVVSRMNMYDLKYAMRHGVDFVVVSKVRIVETITELRRELELEGFDIRIMAKIESMETFKLVDELLVVADGLLLSRSDLGTQLNPGKVFLMQKAVIAKCNRAGKPIIVAGQMFESMRHNCVPKLVDVVDAGNAVLDGADCVMLTGASANGSYPVHAVREMVTAIRDVEMTLWYRHHFTALVRNNFEKHDAPNCVAIEAVNAARVTLSSIIIVMTTSGRSAQLISKYRPRCPVIAVTRCGRAARLCSLYRNIIPVLFDQMPLDNFADDVDLRIKYAMTFARHNKFLKSGDAVLIVGRSKEGFGFNNCIRIVYSFFQPQSLETVLAHLNE